MKSRSTWLMVALALALAATLAACSAPRSQGPVTQPGSTASGTVITISLADPFAYCAVVGTVDSPDARYTGPQIPDTVINGYKKAAGLESIPEPMDQLRKSTIWRCMDHKVYACNFGANLTCDSKANTDRTPTQAMGDYCAANPDSGFIPMAVTGHDTVYSWRCTNSQAQVVEQVATVDAQGYLSQIWYPITPAP
jgi:hypothetical protein